LSPDDGCPSASPSGGEPQARRAGRVPTIFAMGGGGFTMEPENPALDEYVRTLAPVREPRICLLPTAGGDSEDQIRRFHAAFADHLCEPTHVSLFRLGSRPVPLRDHLLAQDVIYVGGGSLVNLLALWRAHGVDVILREAWQAGIVLARLSAGSMCWFEHGITKSIGSPSVARGLGFLPGSNSVHYDGEPERRPASSRRWRAARPDRAGASPTASACCSEAPASPRSWPRGRARGRTASTWSMARWSRSRSSRACSRSPHASILRRRRPSRSCGRSGRRGAAACSTDRTATTAPAARLLSGRPHPSI
jgi:peptidase E